MAKATAGSKTWHLCLDDGRLECAPRTKVRGPSRLIERSELWSGWSSRRFIEMTDSRVWEFAFERLCPECFAPAVRDEGPALPPEAAKKMTEVKAEPDEPLHDHEAYPVCPSCWMCYNARLGGCPQCD